MLALTLEYNFKCSLHLEVEQKRNELRKYEEQLLQRTFKTNSLVLELSLLLYQSKKISKEAGKKIDIEQSEIHVDDDSLRKASTFNPADISEVQNLVTFAYARQNLEELKEKEVEDIKAKINQL